MFGSSSKQASSQQQASSSTREMGGNQKFVMVLRIRLKFWWMIPMHVKYNHTEFGQETQPWRPGTGCASGGPRFQNLSKMAREFLFLAFTGAYPVLGEGHWPGN